MPTHDDILDLLGKLIERRRLLSQDIQAALKTLQDADAAIHEAWGAHRRLALIRAASDPEAEPDEN